jgi:hypothetical protein
MMFLRVLRRNHWQILIAILILVFGGVWQYLQVRGAEQRELLRRSRDTFGAIEGQSNPVETLIKRTDRESTELLLQIAQDPHAIVQYRIEAIQNLSPRMPQKGEEIAKILVPTENLAVRQAVVDTLDTMQCGVQCRTFIRSYLQSRAAGERTEEEEIFSERPSDLADIRRLNAHLEAQLQKRLRRSD